MLENVVFASRTRPRQPGIGAAYGRILIHVVGVVDDGSSG